MKAVENIVENPYVPSSLGIPGLPVKSISRLMAFAASLNEGGLHGSHTHIDH